MYLSVRARQALDFAAVAHENQKDKGGTPYMAHVFSVAMGVAHLGEDYFITAVLHDVVEDTEFSNGTIKAMFGPVVAHAVEAMTHHTEEGEGYWDYLVRVKENPIARMVKLSDLNDNLTEYRLETVPGGDRKRKKYREAKEFLLKGMSHVSMRAVR